MVAFNSTRRSSARLSPASRCDRDALPQTPLAQPPETWDTVAGSRGDAASVAVDRNSAGEIVCLRIGRRRTLGAAPQRRIAEVRELACQRIAVRLELGTEIGSATSSVVWQLYNHRGRLVAAMQLTPDGRNALLTSYDNRHVCRLVRDDAGELQCVEQWRM